MARQKRFKKIKLPDFAARTKEAFFKSASGAALGVLFLAIVFFLAKAFLYKADYFRLAAVETRDVRTGQTYASFANSDIAAAYSGKNIFRIDIKRIARYLREMYPSAK